MRRPGNLSTGAESNEPPYDRSTLELDLRTLLALAYEPVTRTEWNRLARAAGLRIDGQLISTRQMLPFCERWAETRAIVARPLSGQQVVYHVRPALSIPYLEAAERENRLAPLWDAVREVKGDPDDRRWSYSTWSGPRLVRTGTELRIAVARADHAAAVRTRDEVARWLDPTRQREELANWLVATIGDEPRAEWIAMLGDTHGELYLERLAELARVGLRPLSASVIDLAPLHPLSRIELTRWLSVAGRADEAAALAIPEQKDAIALVGALFGGDPLGAVAAGKRATEAMTKRRKYRQLRGLPGLCHALARVAVAHQDPVEWEALGRSVESAKAAKAGYPIGYAALSAFHESVRSGRAPEPIDLQSACGLWDGRWPVAPWPSVLTVGLVHIWLQLRDRRVVARVREWLERAEAGGFDSVARELAAVVEGLEDRAVPDGTLAACFHAREPWEVTLDSLEGLAARLTPAPESTAPEAHLVWEVALGKSSVAIEPRLASGPRAARGQKVPLSRLLSGTVDAVSDRDRRVLTLVELEELDPWSRRKKPRRVLGERALLGLVDHPNVVRVDGSPLRVSRGEPELRVHDAGATLLVSIHPPRLAYRPLAYEEQGHGHLIVYERDDALAEIAKTMGEASFHVPKRMSDRLGNILGALGSSVRVSAAADIEIAMEERPPDSRPVAVLRWDGATLHVRLRAAPLGVAGPHVRPGDGAEVVAATVDGAPLRTRRDLLTERQSLRALLDACPVLAELPERQGERASDDLYQAMAVLLELDAAGDSVVLAWPHGQKLPTPVRRGTSDARVRIREAAEWLTVDVQLRIDEETVIGFRELLEGRRGRFVEIGQGRFVALTEDLMRRIDALEGLARPRKKELQVNPVVLPLVQELTEGAAEVTLNRLARVRLERLEKAAELQPRVPRRFEAELRDYQREGFTWLARLAEAGLGACLADDMGLGKTVQTLALLVSRQKRGPALVVAPTSVASNWIDEARRFAPSLRPHALAAAADRGELVQAMGESDLLVCSYGLLVTEAERLREVAFDTIVFDEAHLLKNARTQRTRAAAALQASFRLSLSGTPIENHLGELWSLIQVTVPGLLGSEKHFEARFAGPIREGDRERARQLRALLRPFLLRRTKAQVLDELPPRTEVTVRVTPTDGERAFYEAVRRRALEEIGEAGTTEKGRLQLLAQITRLRQASVDPRLVAEDGPAGAKIDALMERLHALRTEGHRALVFSQFLGAMERVRERLDEDGVEHLSLDGSTSAKERAKRIAAFQDGEADVFVMSLKAGGVGVNLTGADYVIHLDPWWNPAVEDQATGRSHRIGQQRPVTVYRLVTEGTIEEKILALHRDKRELAQDLLAEMDRARKLDLDELRALL